jgi:hypothetical protein
MSSAGRAVITDPRIILLPGDRVFARWYPKRWLQHFVSAGSSACRYLANDLPGLAGMSAATLLDLNRAG